MSSFSIRNNIIQITNNIDLTMSLRKQQLQDKSVNSDALKNLQNIENGKLNDNKLSLEQVDETSQNHEIQHQNYKCNLNYTNESICSGNSGQNNETIHSNQKNSNNHNNNNNDNNHNKNGLAIIDDVKTAHTASDQCKITTKSLSTQLPHEPFKENSNNFAYDVNGNTASNTQEERNEQKLSTKIVGLLRQSKPIALVVINSVLAVLITISVCITMGLDYTIPAIVIGLIAIIASSGLWYWLYIAAVTAPRDVRALYRYIKLLTLVRRCQRKNVAICDLFHHYVAKHPQKACIIFEGKEWTFRDINELSNRIANLFQQHGFKRGDVIGLFMENRPEFVATWLGLSKIGVIVPLINTNQRQASLIHSIEIAKCQALIYGDSLTESVTEILHHFTADSISWYQFNEERNDTVTDQIKNLNELLKNAPKTDVVVNASTETHHNQLLYIYTSGTTGLPKAAVITHSRYIFIAAGIHYMANFRPDDIFYTPLPLYHTAGGVMSIGQALLFGSTVVIRKKFSASGYFPDCQRYKCTVAQYIGEMCRYILATPPSSADASHSLRVIFGNGLRPQIWPQFINRFKIPQVAEFYGATEGNANIVNISNVVGAIGFVSRIIPSVYPISIIKADPNTGEPIRNKNGLCQLCKPNEPGVFVGKIMPGNPSRAFLGYVDKAASSKKVVVDVFKKGDSAFLSGDLLVSDDFGNLYFKDRTGDTFRWKGENVSTSEVEAQVSNVAGYRDTVVYGIEIPNTEGRAGMAAILDVDQTIDLEALATGLKALLPTYARPQFIRLLNKVDMTGTFKLKKLDLQKEGFNPSKIDDSLFYLLNGKYNKLDKAVYEQILNGELRF